MFWKWQRGASPRSFFHPLYYYYYSSPKWGRAAGSTWQFMAGGSQVLVKSLRQLLAALSKDLDLSPSSHGTHVTSAAPDTEALQHHERPAPPLTSPGPGFKGHGPAVPALAIPQSPGAVLPALARSPGPVLTISPRPALASALRAGTAILPGLLSSSGTTGSTVAGHGGCTAFIRLHVRLEENGQDTFFSPSLAEMQVRDT